MQKFPEHPSAITPGRLEEAFERIRADMHAHGGAVVPDTSNEPDDEDFPERPVMGQELLLATREPIEWILALARRLASGDPHDVAAIDRVTAAFHSHLAGGALGVKLSDALTAFGILIGALDPAVVVESATHAVAGGVATLLAIDGSVLTAQLKRLVASTQTSTRGTCATPQRSHRRARARHGL